MIYGYCRTSTVQQHEDRQLVTMEKYNVPKQNIYLEKITGKTMDRPELQKLLATLKSGDTLIVHDFSRLSRSTGDLLKIVEDLNKRNVTLISNKENLDTSTPTGKLMLTMIAAINQFEIENTKERQREGIQEAKKRGAYRQTEATDDDILALKERVDAGVMTVTAACRTLGFTRATCYNRLKAM